MRAIGDVVLILPAMMVELTGDSRSTIELKAAIKVLISRGFTVIYIARSHISSASSLVGDAEVSAQSSRFSRI